MSDKSKHEPKKSETPSTEFRCSYHESGSFAGMIVTKGDLNNLTLVKLMPDE